MRLIAGPMRGSLEEEAAAIMAEIARLEQLAGQLGVTTSFASMLPASPSGATCV